MNRQEKRRAARLKKREETEARMLEREARTASTRKARRAAQNALAKLVAMVAEREAKG